VGTLRARGAPGGRSPGGRSRAADRVHGVPQGNPAARPVDPTPAGRVPPAVSQLGAAHPAAQPGEACLGLPPALQHPPPAGGRAGAVHAGCCAPPHLHPWRLLNQSLACAAGRSAATGHVRGEHGLPGGRHRGRPRLWQVHARQCAVWAGRQQRRRRRRRPQHRGRAAARGTVPRLAGGRRPALHIRPADPGEHRSQPLQKGKRRQV